MRGREGDSFHSPDVQRERIEAWANYKNAEIVDWYIDLDRPAKERDSRPEFDRMMADAARDARPFDVIALYRLSRFARSLKTAANAYSELAKRGVSLVSVTEDIDTSTASGQLIQHLLFAMSEFESQRIGEEWSAIHAARRKRGLAHIIRPFYGYDIERGHMTVNEREAEAVRLAFRMKAEGAGTTEIQRALCEAGHKSKSGLPRINTRSIRTMLANHHYAGLVKLPDGTYIEARHPAIVDRELWETVQAVTPRVKHVYRAKAALLSGLLVCVNCGYRMEFKQPLKHRVRGEDTGYVMPAAYRCSAKRNARPCPHGVVVNAAAIEAYVEQQFLQRFDPSLMPNKGRITQAARATEIDRERARLVKRRDDIDRALDTLADERFMLGTTGSDEYHRQTSRYLEERAAVVQRITEIQGAIAAERQPDALNALAYWPHLTMPDRREALRGIIESIVVSTSPRKGKGVAKLMSERVTINWIA